MKIWVKILHLFFIINTYFNYMEDTEDRSNNDYSKRIDSLVNELQSLFSELGYFKEAINDKVKGYLQVISDYNNHINFPRESDSSLGQEWKDIWEDFEELSVKVSKALSFLSYFNLIKSKETLNYELMPDRVWGKLNQIVDGDKIEQLKSIEKILYQLDEINKDFSILNELVNSVEKLGIGFLSIS